MEIEWEPRPHPSSRDWHDRPVAVAASSSSPPLPFAATSPSFTQRRRSSAAHTRPAGPPPNLPIPNVPGPATLPYHGTSLDHLDGSSSYLNGRGPRVNSSARLGASPNLAVVVSFPHASTSHADSPIEELCDPPPPSFLHSSSSRTQDSHRDPAPDRHLPPPRESRGDQRLPSSRRALTRALELAREAVQLDSMNDNPEAAVQAYGRSVALLSEVMDRVRRGEDSTDSHRRRRRRSVAAQEEEIKRLQNIHDTYADRMNILSIIYSIPAVPYSSTGMYAALTDSTASVSPTNSASPSSDSSPQIPSPSHTLHNPSGQYHPDAHPGHDPDFDSPETTNSIVLTFEEPSFAEPNISGLLLTPVHPYVLPYDPFPQPTQQPVVPIPAVTKAAPLTRRVRASSNLPPPPPPPTTTLPPAPMPASLDPFPEPASPQKHLEVRTRQRGESVGHRRTGSSGLGPLKEEHDDSSFGAPPNVDETSRIEHVHPDTPRGSKRGSHPLPPLPSLDTSPGTSRNFKPSQPTMAPRPRGSSQLTTRSEMSSQPIINQATNQGTIFQRRSTKSSAPPTSRSSSPADSNASSRSVPGPKSTSLPGASPLGLVTGRSRSSSQPGRRPSLVSGNISPLDARPPLPGNTVNGTGLRKNSIPSKLIPNTQQSQLTVQTDIPPLTRNNSFSLVPPAVFPGNLPTTPTSPLPPAPPSDPLLKPYHLMNLLRDTMTSATGGYVTRRLHVPHEVWSQGGAKLSNVVEKVRVVAILSSALEDLQASSSEYFGAGNVSSGLGLGIGSIGRKEAGAWLSKLDEFSSVCDGVVTNFGKKLGVGEGFVLKKTTWGDKLTRRFDKFTNGKNLDSPAAYVKGLEKLFLHTQLLDEHMRAVLCQPTAPAYAAFPMDIRTSIEQKLRRASEFFATVVLNFVIRDLSQLLDKYAKKCEKWLAE